MEDRSRENLQKATQASDHLLAMINDLLNLSKIEAGHMDVNPAPFDVRKMLASCCATIEPLVKAEVKLIQEVADEVGEAHSDESRLKQIVINLLSNARKFTEQGEIRVRASVLNGMLEISVADSGVGIPAEALDTIFEEFQQVKGEHQKEKGTGLGLSITKGWTELLGGSIGVESEVGKGSTFTVRVPVMYKEG